MVEGVKMVKTVLLIALILLPACISPLGIHLPRYLFKPSGVNIGDTLNSVMAQDLGEDSVSISKQGGKHYYLYTFAKLIGAVIGNIGTEEYYGDFYLVIEFTDRKVSAIETFQENVFKGPAYKRALEWINSRAEEGNQGIEDNTTLPEQTESEQPNQ